MTRSRSAQFSIVAFGVFVATILVTATASAHVTANPNHGPAGGYFKTDLRVPHGCGDSATTALRVQIPSGVTSVKPQVVPGWEIEITTGELDEPYDSHGELVTEGVTEVAWIGGPLPDEHMQEFGITMRLPDNPDDRLYFPTIQECESGEHAWIEIPAEGEAWGSLDEPAPFVDLIGEGSDDHGDEVAEEVEANDAQSDDDSGIDPLVLIALVLGTLGVVASGSVLLMVRNRT